MNVSKQTPARPQTIHSDILVPLLWALVISTPTSVFMLVLGIDNGVKRVWVLPFVMWVVITVGVFIFYSRLVRRTWFTVESQYEQPPMQYYPQPQTVAYEERVIGLRNFQQGPVRKQLESKSELVSFAERCAERGTAIRNFSDMKPKKYIELRDRLISSGYAEWINPSSPTQGWRMIARPEEVADNVVDLGRKVYPIDGKPFFVGE